MAKYIDADKAIEALDNLCEVVCQYSKTQRSVMCGACPLGGAFDAIDDIPAADVAEVKHGRWEYIGGYGYQYRCSKCFKKRLSLFRIAPPTAVHPLTWRPDFTKQGSSLMDMCWMVWDKPTTVYVPLDRPLQIKNLMQTESGDEVENEADRC